MPKIKRRKKRRRRASSWPTGQEPRGDCQCCGWPAPAYRLENIEKVTGFKFCLECLGAAVVYSQSLEAYKMEEGGELLIPYKEWTNKTKAKASVFAKAFGFGWPLVVE